MVSGRRLRIQSPSPLQDRWLRQQREHPAERCFLSSCSLCLLLLLLLLLLMLWYILLPPLPPLLRPEALLPQQRLIRHLRLLRRLPPLLVLLLQKQRLWLRHLKHRLLFARTLAPTPALRVDEERPEGYYHGADKAVPVSQK